MDTTKRMGELVKRYREVHGLSIQELADRADISRTYVYDLEKGFRSNGKPINVTLIVARKIAEALRMDFKDFLEECGYFDDKGTYRMAWPVEELLDILPEKLRQRLEGNTHGKVIGFHEPVSKEDIDANWLAKVVSAMLE